MSKEFQWTPELKIEFLDWLLNEKTPDPTKELVRRFIERKQPKPEWEIIQYTYPSGATLPDYNHKLAASRDYPIYSVKRLSDNSIWTVDDKFRADAGCDLTIKRFSVCDDAIRVYSAEWGYWLLGNIYRVPLFITEDGCQAYENDKVWVLSTDRWHVVSVKSPNIPYRGDKEQFKYFSTKEAAEEYILSNKPCLSLREVLPYVGLGFDKEILAIVQSKITNKPTING